MSIPRPAVLVLFLLVQAWMITSVSAQEQRLPSQRHSASVQAPEDIPQEILPPVNGDSLRASSRTDQIGPYRFGKILKTQLTPQQHGSWEQLPDGHQLWRLRIRSQNARSLSLAFSTFQLPKDAELFVYGPDRSLVRGPYTQTDATAGQLWTPIVTGETLIVELEIPRNRHSELALTIGKIVHGYRSLRPSPQDGTSSKAGSCNLDVACEEADPWREQVRSVGRYTFQSGSFSSRCTGSLVNNTANDGTPYFLTAEHCISSPEQAQSMVFYWNYQNKTCRPPGSPENGEVTDDSLTAQTSSGAILRARYGNTHEDGRISGKPDLALVEINDEIPLSYQLYFNGWSRRDTTTRRSVTIHHPQGHGKRISFDEDPSTITAYGSQGGGDTHLRIGNWELGTTEGGSSGAPLYNRNQRVIGVLSGGLAGCDGDGDIGDNNDPDWYGRIAPGFENGDYQGATLADWLNPNGSGAMVLDGRNLTNDSAPPAPATQFQVAEVTPDSITLSWVAPGDDGREGTADQYLLRYRSKGPITTREQFNNATPVSDLPDPKSAGTLQRTTLSAKQDSSYYFALVTIDKVGNASPLASIERDVTPVQALRIVTPPQPNPTTARTTVRFVVRRSQRVRVTLYDALGRRVRKLYDDEATAFQRQTVSANLSGLSSGVYFLHLRGKRKGLTQKIVVVR